MDTIHHILNNDSRSMAELDYNSISLGVTSPPYPMISMWDEIFTQLNNSIGEA